MDWRERLDDPRVLDTIRAVGRAVRMDEQARDDFASWALMESVLIARAAPADLDRGEFHALLFASLRVRVGNGVNLRDLGRRGDKGKVVVVSADIEFEDGDARLALPDTGIDPLLVVLRRELLEELVEKYERQAIPRQTTLCPECLTRPPNPKCAGYCNACSIRIRSQNLGTCTEDGCEKHQRARGLCRWHYYRALRAQKESAK